MDSASDLPGTLRKDADPVELQKQIEILQKEVEKIHRAQKELPDGAHVSSDARPKCFIIMPFGNDDLDIVYKHFLLPQLDEVCGLECCRGDDLFGSSYIMGDILQTISQADIAIADLTGRNANVFYEIGICHALNKPVLLLAQSKDDIPFDVAHLRVYLYEYTPLGCKYLEQNIKKHVDAMLVRAEA